jgi:hypothetical protein
MPFTASQASFVRIASAMLVSAVVLPAHAAAQRDARTAPATQGFAAADCREDCTLDSLVIDVDRGRRNQPAVVSASLLLIDTVALARRGAPPAPKERVVPVWVSCDAMPCAAAMLTGRLSDKRIDDARVVRRTQVAWPLPSALLQRVQKSTPACALAVDRHGHTGAGGVGEVRDHGDTLLIPHAALCRDLRAVRRPWRQRDGGRCGHRDRTADDA